MYKENKKGYSAESESPLRLRKLEKLWPGYAEFTKTVVKCKLN